MARYRLWTPDLQPDAGGGVYPLCLRHHRRKRHARDPGGRQLQPQRQGGAHHRRRDLDRRERQRTHRHGLHRHRHRPCAGRCELHRPLPPARPRQALCPVGGDGGGLAASAPHRGRQLCHDPLPGAEDHLLRSGGGPHLARLGHRRGRRRGPAGGRRRTAAQEEQKEQKRQKAGGTEAGPGRKIREKHAPPGQSTVPGGAFFGNYLAVIGKNEKFKGKLRKSP